MTIYKNLTWEKLGKLMMKFGLLNDSPKSFKLNGIEIFCNRIDIYPTCIYCCEEGWEYYPSYSYDDDDWDSDVPYSKDIVKYEFAEGSRFNLIVCWEEFEIKIL